MVIERGVWLRRGAYQDQDPGNRRYEGVVLVWAKPDAERNVGAVLYIASIPVKQKENHPSTLFCFDRKWPLKGPIQTKNI